MRSPNRRGARTGVCALPGRTEPAGRGNRGAAQRRRRDADFAEALAEAERLMDAAAQAEEEALAAESALALARDAETFLRAPLRRPSVGRRGWKPRRGRSPNLLRSGRGDLWPAGDRTDHRRKRFRGAPLARRWARIWMPRPTSRPPPIGRITFAARRSRPAAGRRTACRKVQAPAALARGLAQIGVVARGEGGCCRAGSSRGSGWPRSRAIYGAGTDLPQRRRRLPPPRAG